MRTRKKRVGILLVGGFLFVSLGVKGTLTIVVGGANRIAVSNPDMTTLADGTYVGEYSIAPVYARVEVFVAEHQITEIKIMEHQNGLGGKAETIVDDVIREQSLAVDGVSGATVSSKCLIKAIEDALQSKNQ